MSNILKSLSKVPNAKTVMSVRNIGKSFFEGGGEPLVILRDGNFDLHKGEVVALVGPSGCGKSTLLQCVGLLDRPTRGQVIIAGVPVQKLSEKDRTMIRRNKLGFIYQRNNLLSDFTAIENVMMPMLTMGVSEDEAFARAGKLLKFSKVSHRSLHLPAKMSGGEQQRVAVARALANNPEIILADEPTGSLDPLHAKLVFDLLLNVVRKSGAAMLFVTHDMELASRADRTITIKNGKII